MRGWFTGWIRRNRESEDLDGPDYVSSGGFSTVFAGELNHLGIRSDDIERPEGGRLRGLAISGGGIRSASFGLGILQALARKRVLETVDYLSTVSGGGYIGSSLTWFLTRQVNEQTFEYGVEPHDFPLGRAKRGDGGNRALEYIRQHGNYLTPGRGLGGISMVAVVLRASVVSVFIYGGLLVAVLGLGLAIGLFGERPEHARHPSALGMESSSGLQADLEERRSKAPAGSSYEQLMATGTEELARARAALASRAEWMESRLGLRRGALDDTAEVFGNPLLAFAGLLVAGFVLLSLLYAVLCSFVRLIPRYRARTLAQKGFGYLLTAAAAVTVLGLLPIVHDALRGIERGLLTSLGIGSDGEGGIVAAVTGGSTAIGGVLGFFQARAQQSESAKSGWLAGLRLYAGVSLLLFGVLVGAFAIADATTTTPFLWLAIGALAALVGTAVNLNYLGLHRMYRDRLMEAFMPGATNVANGEWGPAAAADGLSIDRVCDGSNRRPYHLVNTNVVLVDSNVGRYRGRGGDSFVLSRLYCGSEATGWRRSVGYMKREGPNWLSRVWAFLRRRKSAHASGRGMTLPTAMAISGAAANPNAGVAGRGATRSRPVSILMSLLNLRLGYWAANPRTGRFLLPPNFIDPGLRALFGRDLSESEHVVELTDGGHFENLGLYELIRRRVDEIIVCDGGCDPDFRFDDLSTATERVRADFGVDIVFGFDLESPRLSGLLPGSGGVVEVSGDEPDGTHSTVEKIDVAERGYAIAQIRYPELAGVGPDGRERTLPEKKGWLIYVKTTVIAGLPQDIYGYKLSHPKFPDETTGDQFFDERQLEAYRELGYQIGKQLAEFSPDPSQPPQPPQP